jgi:hypothetical protein
MQAGAFRVRPGSPSSCPVCKAAAFRWWRASPAGTPPSPAARSTSAKPDRLSFASEVQGPKLMTRGAVEELANDAVWAAGQATADWRVYPLAGPNKTRTGFDLSRSWDSKMKTEGNLDQAKREAQNALGGMKHAAKVEHRRARAGLRRGARPTGCRGQAIVDGETEVNAKLTAAWRSAVARMIEAGYNPADVHETMISVGLSGKERSRRSYFILAGVAIVGVSALLLFSDLRETRQALVLAHSEIETLNRDRARILADLTRTAEEEAEGARAPAANGEAVRAADAKGDEQQEALGREREEGERLKRDLAAARSRIEALKAEGGRALAASGKAVRAAKANGVEQRSARQQAKRR